MAKRSARGTRIKALTQMRQLTFSAPDQLQSRLKGLPIAQFVAAAQGLRPTRSSDVATAATKASLSTLAHRVADLEDEIAALDAMITPLQRLVNNADGNHTWPSMAWASTPRRRCS